MKWNGRECSRLQNPIAYEVEINWFSKDVNFSKWKQDFSKFKHSSSSRVQTGPVMNLSQPRYNIESHQCDNLHYRGNKIVIVI